MRITENHDEEVETLIQFINVGINFSLTSMKKEKKKKKTSNHFQKCFHISLVIEYCIGVEANVTNECTIMFDSKSTNKCLDFEAEII